MQGSLPGTQQQTVVGAGLAVGPSGYNQAAECPPEWAALWRAAMTVDRVGSLPLEQAVRETHTLVR